MVIQKLYGLVGALLLLLMGCAGLADYDVDLPGGYSIVRTSAHQVKIAPKHPDKSGWGADVIPAKVIEAAWNENYILAKQLDLIEDPNNQNGYQIPDSTSEYFWIIELQSNTVIGPLTEKEFQNKKHEFGLTEDLKKVEDFL